MPTAIPLLDGSPARVRWESVPEQVRDYLDTHPKATGGTVIEREGRPAYRLEPLHGVPSGWTAAKNVRRCALIDGRLTADERWTSHRLVDTQLRVSALFTRGHR